MAAADPTYKKCGNGFEWFGYHTSADGVIRTILYGCGEAILDYGNCNDQGSGSVGIYLDNSLLDAQYYILSKLISFSYTNGSILEIKGVQSGIIKFNKFHVIECYLCKE